MHKVAASFECCWQGSAKLPTTTVVLTMTAIRCDSESILLRYFFYWRCVQVKVTAQEGLVTFSHRLHVFSNFETHSLPAYQVSKNNTWAGWMSSDGQVTNLPVPEFHWCVPTVMCIEWRNEWMNLCEVKIHCSNRSDSSRPYMSRKKLSLSEQKHSYSVCIILYSWFLEST